MYMVRLTKNANFWPKTSCFGPKWQFFLDQNFFLVAQGVWEFIWEFLRYHTPL